MKQVCKHGQKIWFWKKQTELVYRIWAKYQPKVNGWIKTGLGPIKILSPNKVVCDRSIWSLNAGPTPICLTLFLVFYNLLSILFDKDLFGCKMCVYITD
jgi:hypothetical protein